MNPIRDALAGHPWKNPLGNGLAGHPWMNPLGNGLAGHPWMNPLGMVWPATLIKRSVYSCMHNKLGDLQWAPGNWTDRRR